MRNITIPVTWCPLLQINMEHDFQCSRPFSLGLIGFYNIEGNSSFSNLLDPMEELFNIICLGDTLASHFVDDMYMRVV